MKEKILRNKKIYILFMTLIMLIASVLALGLSTTTAEAYTVNAYKNKTYGTYSTNGSSYSSGCPGNFSIYMHPSSYSSSSSSISNDVVLNWTYVYSLSCLSVASVERHNKARKTGATTAKSVWESHIPKS